LIQHFCFCLASSDTVEEALINFLRQDEINAVPSNEEIERNTHHELIKMASNKLSHQSLGLIPGMDE
jgi:hypothetical protein